jgi:hypothetical protein
MRTERPPGGDAPGGVATPPGTATKPTRPDQIAKPDLTATARHDVVVAGLARRREATYRLPPLRCGCRDPLICTCRVRRQRPVHQRPVPMTVVSLRRTLDVLRRAWRYADPHDRNALCTLVAYLREVAR